MYVSQEALIDIYFSMDSYYDSGDRRKLNNGKGKGKGAKSTVKVRSEKYVAYFTSLPEAGLMVSNVYLLDSSKDSLPPFEDDDYSNEDLEQATDAPTNNSESNDSLVTAHTDVSNDSD